MHKRIILAGAAAALLATATGAHAFRLLHPAMRFFEPDAGLPVRFFVQGADAEMQTAVEAAMAVWNDVPCASIVLELAGEVTTPSRFDGKNVISFADPLDVIADPVGCAGALAVGGFYLGRATRVVDGVTYRQIVETDITFADEWAGCFGTTTAEVLVRAIGRAVGAEDEADLCRLYPLDAPAMPLPPPEMPAAPRLDVRTLHIGKRHVTLRANFATPARATMAAIAGEPVVLMIGSTPVTIPAGEWTTRRVGSLVHQSAVGRFTLRTRDGVHFTLAATLNALRGGSLTKHSSVTLTVNGESYVGSKR